MVFGLTCFWLLAPTIFRYRIKIQDVSLEQKDQKKRVIIRTHGAHWISRSWAASQSQSAARVVPGSPGGVRVGKSVTESFTIEDTIRVTTKGHRTVRVVFSGTGHPLLDTKQVDESEEEGWFMTRAAAVATHAACALLDKVSFLAGQPDAQDMGRTALPLVQALTGNHLLLLRQDGKPEERVMDTSRGLLHIPFPATLVRVAPLGVPSGAWMIILLTVSIVPPAVVSADSLFTLLCVIVSLLLAAVIGLVRWSMSLPTLLEHRLKQHSRNLHQANPDPQACPRGPDRAVRAGQLWELFSAFEDCIRDRTMYYVATNILKPLTKSKRLSYAELAGPNHVMWFVSHFWGTPFRHFVLSIRRHGETIAEGNPWTSLTYWICSLSNNQWRVAEEVGATWDQSSFYLALTCGNCQGTAMILDDQAMPLTRAWCLFEVLQTKSIQTKQSNFAGLWLCTSTGILHKGKAGVDVAMRIAERLSCLKLEDATASVQKDKDMIDDLVSNMPGGFPAMNSFVRNNIAEALIAMQEAFTNDFDNLLDTLGHKKNPCLQGIQSPDQDADVKSPSKIGSPRSNFGDVLPCNLEDPQLP
eukprot:gb/GFBE01027277.1/.p1 GENE.gb/GFBE01027277.1/~~gb/GFBE01027277.1/.p1  ORF type:complete len:584 (+),score=90.46 gb/GFBE01027277.1/:1-1752(+)